MRFGPCGPSFTIGWKADVDPHGGILRTSRWHDSSVVERPADSRIVAGSTPARASLSAGDGGRRALSARFESSPLVGNCNDKGAKCHR